jgi:hypothetical protein
MGMEPQQNTTFTFKRSAEETSTAPTAKERITFITPFLALSLLMLPSLLILDYSKLYTSYNILDSLEYTGFVKGAIWVLMSLIVLSGLLYLIRARGIVARAGVALLLLIVVGAFAYYILPQS